MDTPEHIHDFRGTSPKICIDCGANSDDECAYGHARTDDTILILGNGRKKCKICISRKGKERLSRMSESVKEKHLATKRDSVNRYRTRTKQSIFDYYGTHCACCGETTPVFLVIDHINGGGNEHRRSLSPSGKMGDHLYRWLVREGFPPGFQTLCFNCNHAKHVLGECPHQIGRVAT